MSFITQKGFYPSTHSTTPIKPKKHNHQVKKSTNEGSVTAMMNRLAAQRKQNSGKKTPIKAQAVVPRYPKMEPAALALKAVVRMKNLAKQAGIAKAKATSNFTRLSSGLLKREKHKNISLVLTAKRKELTKELGDTQIKLAKIKEQKGKLRTLMRELLNSNKFDSKFSVSYMDKEEKLRQSSKDLKKDAATIKQKIDLLDTQIKALEVTPLSREESTPVAAKERSLSPAGSDYLDQARLSDSASSDDASQGRESVSPASAAEPQVEPQPLTVRSTEDVISEHNSSITAEVTTSEQEKPTAASPVRVISVDPRTSQRLSAYLGKINKTGLMGLAMGKKKLTSEAEVLSSNLSFVEYMHSVKSTPGTRDSLRGILKEAKKASTVLVQLQKKLQREWGTYEKTFDKSMIVPEKEREEIIEGYAHQHGLDPSKLKHLMTEVANATSKDREAKTAALTAYMTSD